LKKKYSFRFIGVEKNLYRKYGFLRGSDYGAYDAQQSLVELQKRLHESTLLTVMVKDLEASQTYHFESVLVDPIGTEFNLLDELQRQLLEAGEAIDGAKIYTEINRQFNIEAEAVHSSLNQTMTAPIQKKNILQKMFPYLFKPKQTEQLQQVYNQPIFPPREPVAAALPKTEIHGVLVYDYEMLFTKKDGSQISCGFQSAEENETRNSALDKFFVIDGDVVFVDDEEIFVSDLKSIKLKKLHLVDIFSLPEELNDVGTLSELPE
jgi:hypothetical protein